MSAQGGASGWKLVGAREMRELDRTTIEERGVPDEVLMESAGRAVTEAALDRLSRAGPRPRIVVLCGSGNNGGDGFVCARLLHQEGLAPVVWMLGAKEKLGGAALANFRRIEGSVPIEPRGETGELEADLLIDALFGTGVTRPLEGTALAVVRRVERSRPRLGHVLSIDLPSGLDADTGQPQGAAIRADETVTIGLPKLGLALEPGRSLAGRIRVARIGIADEHHPPAGIPTELWTPELAARELPSRARSGHKGSFGHALVIAGSEGRTGAAALAAEAAVRGGAGLVTVACPRSLSDVLEVKCTEAMTVALDETPERALAAAAEKPLLELAEARNVVALGPGVGRSQETQALVRRLATRLSVPLVLDADALMAFAGEPERLRAARAPVFLTPHPGEAAALLADRDAAAINRDRVDAATVLARRSGAFVILKGAATVIVEPDARMAINPTGGPLLASGGTGDVLTGLLAAVLAQRPAGFEAAALAAYLHGAAADALSVELGAGGLAATDLAREIPRTMARLRRLGGAGEGFGSRGLLLPFPGN